MDRRSTSSAEICRERMLLEHVRRRSEGSQETAWPRLLRLEALGEGDFADRLEEQQVGLHDLPVDALA